MMFWLQTMLIHMIYIAPENSHTSDVSDVSDVFEGSDDSNIQMTPWSDDSDGSSIDS